MRNRCTRLGAFALTILLSAALVAPACAFAITRSAVIKRANVWVNAKVPYSQSRYATVEAVPHSRLGRQPIFEGYRTDCSGFASMAIGLVTSTGKPLSLDTGSFPSRLVKIQKSQLLPGDLILRPKTLKIDGKTVPYGHAVVFGGWTDS